MTLIELAIAAVLLVLTAWSAILFVQSTSHAYRTETVSAELDRLARETLDAIETNLRPADQAAILPVAAQAPASLSSVGYQRGIGFLGGVIQWGNPERIQFEYDAADPDDGVDNDLDGTVDEGEIVWIENQGLAGERRMVLCRWVAENLDGEAPGNGLDDNGNGLIDEAGFCADFSTGRATVRLTLRRKDPFGNLVDRTLQRSIALRNTEN